MICGAIAGAGLGFLWFNAYPAEVFMGDVGALALGAALGTIAVIVRQEIVLFIMGGVFVVETLSVMIQVASFKTDRQARVPHGAAAPPLRAEGLEGEPGRGALLDHHDAAGAVRPVDAEAALMTLTHATNRNDVVVLGLGLTGLSLARWLARHGARVRVADTRAAPPHAAALARELPGVAAGDAAPFADATLRAAPT